MKKIISLFIIILFAFANNSCKKAKEEVDEITEFDIDYQTSMNVPTNTISLNVPIDFTSPNVATNSTTKLAENKTASNMIDYIKMTKFDVSVGTGNLDFLKSLNIYVKASGIGETLIASKAVVPTGVTSISADLSDVNIKDFITQPNIQFRVTITIDASTLAGQTLILDSRVHVKATVIK